MPPPRPPATNGQPIRPPARQALEDVWRLTLAMAPLALLAPLVLQRGFESLRAGRPLRLFEFAGVSVALAVVCAAGWIVARRRLSGAAVAPVGCFLVVVFIAVQRMGTSPPVSWDFHAYERAGDAMRAGETPYPLVNTYYTYPPPLAQAMAAAATAFQAATGEPRAAGWAHVFYLWQLLQIGLIAGAFVMLYRFAVALGLDDTPAAVVVALLLVVNTPMVFSTGLSQVNVLVLVLVLAAVGGAQRGDALAGLALAAAAVIKLYPFMLFPAWVAAGRWRPVAWATAWTAAIVAVSRPWMWWVEFSRVWLRPQQLPAAGDNTLFNLLANGARLTGLTAPGAPPPAVRYVWLAVVAVIAAWGVKRIFARLASRGRRSSGESRPGGADLFAVTAEVLAISLFLSPRVWVHQFVFAVPVAVLAAATAPPERRRLVGLGAILMFAMPWSDLFLFGYHRLIGLCLVLYACRPPRTDRPEGKCERGDSNPQGLSATGS